MMLPKAFCWTRFGVEAGQDVEAILRRKEAERRRNDGLFLWGVGNSVLPSLPALLAHTGVPKAVFSPIRSPSRMVDRHPTRLAVWTRARTIDGRTWSLPEGSLVTSHAHKSVGRHYALVCRSDVPLRVDTHGSVFSFSSLSNLRSGRPVGPSQVTVIVRHNPTYAGDGLEYRATMVVDLVAPYVVALDAPTIVHATGPCSEALLEQCWQARRSTGSRSTTEQYDLFA